MFTTTRIAYFLLFVLLAVHSTAEPPPPISGWGAHPVSETVSAAWLLKSGFTSMKVLPFIVYFKGKPGWVHEKTTLDVHWGKDPSKIRFLVGTVPVEFVYTDADGFVKLYGATVFTALNNVILVSDITSEKPKVETLGYMSLSFGPAENPALVVLERYPQVRLKVNPE
jgi:hypothetical protein